MGAKSGNTEAETVIEAEDKKAKEAGKDKKKRNPVIIIGVILAVILAFIAVEGAVLIYYLDPWGLFHDTAEVEDVTREASLADTDSGDEAILDGDEAETLEADSQEIMTTDLEEIADEDAEPEMEDAEPEVEDAEPEMEDEEPVDTEPPVIEGVMPLSVFMGDAISYKSGITVTDDTDGDVILTVDTTQVDQDTPGTYSITYTARDHAGNTTSETTYVTINEKPDNFIEEDVVLAEAQEVLDQITTDDMGVKEQAYAIFQWVHRNIIYSTTSEKDSWTNGADTGFTVGIGDCFIYFSTAKALLTAAGIPNIDVVRSDTSRARHYWSLVNCGDGWYHFDTCIRADGGETFMYTDAEVAEYAASAAHTDYYTFDHSLYPATPTEPFEMD